MITLVIGASLKSHRFSNMAINRLRDHDFETRAIGLREGTVRDVSIDRGHPDYKDIDTVTLYINPRRQEEYYEYVKELTPRRVIFNPGTENTTFQNKLREAGIEVLEACTLVMISTNQY